MVVEEASLPSQRVVNEGDGEFVLPIYERWQLFLRCLSAIEGCGLESSLVALNHSSWLALHQC